MRLAKVLNTLGKRSRLLLYLDILLGLRIIKKHLLRLWDIDLALRIRRENTSDLLLHLSSLVWIRFVWGPSRDSSLNDLPELIDGTYYLLRLSLSRMVRHGCHTLWNRVDALIRTYCCCRNLIRLLYRNQHLLPGCCSC